MSDFEKKITEHYNLQADKHGDSPQSTMEEQYIREKEYDKILATMGKHVSALPPSKVLDLGCGNGYVLERLRSDCPDTVRLLGIDFTQKFVDIANERKISNSHIEQGDARNLNIENNSLDFMYTERCLINILDWEEQKKALMEISRVLKVSAGCVLLECFSDGLENNNKAREEMGMETLKEAHHNLYFNKEKFSKFIEDTDLEITSIDPFLSTHYFVSRVLHPLMTKGEWKKNTEFVNFMSHALPNTGNYGPLQAVHLVKRGR